MSTISGNIDTYIEVALKLYEDSVVNFQFVWEF